MKTKTKYGLGVCLAFILMAGNGCTNDEHAAWTDPDATDRVMITGSIGEAVTAETRVNKDIFDSYLSGGFSENDQIGFYSQYNNDGGQEEVFSNLCLTYTRNSPEEGSGLTFYNGELGNIPSNWGHVFAYYPYDEENGTEPEEKPDKDRINIYTTTDEDGSSKVIDLLTANTAGLSSSGMIHFNFTHRFSMLFIIPGEGFTNAATKNADGIEVVLKRGIAYARVNPGRTDVTLVPDELGGNKNFTAVLNSKEYTFNGETYSVNSFFYVILPSEVEVDYIKIVDDFGKTQYVRPSSSQLPELAAGIRYPITVYMQGDKPTLWPWKFTPWDQDVIQVDRSAGIYDLGDLEGWISAYNSYYEEGVPVTEPDEEAPLRKYGDYKEGKWTFYLRDDIDCEDLFAENSQGVSQLFTTFQDELYGQNHTLSNLTLPGGLIGTFSGKIENLKLENVTIVAEKEDEGAKGGMVNEMNGGTLTDCKVSGLRIEGGGAVGAIAGSITEGTITGNSCSGILIGTESDNIHGHYIVGTVSDEGGTGTEGPAVTIEDNTSNVIFNHVN